jgi:hypothetical protein
MKKSLKNVVQCRLQLLNNAEHYLNDQGYVGICKFSNSFGLNVRPQLPR